MSKERPSYEALIYARHLALEIERARFGGPFDPERWLRKKKTITVSLLSIASMANGSNHTRRFLPR